MSWQRGDFVDVTADGKTLPAMVVLASENGQSLIVMFDGMLAGHVSMMPLLGTERGYVALMTGEPVQLQRTEGTP